jgi:chaperonin GroES
MTETMPSVGEAQLPATEPEANLRALIESTNIAEDMDEDELEELGKHVSEGFEDDLRSREDWEKNLDEWQKLALQVKEEKTFPWAGAANVKYPLLSVASMQFNARAYPALVPATSDVVKVEVIGKDPDGQKLEKARRIGAYMSYQVLNQMDGWEEDMDRLLLMLPIIGTVFKKTYYDSILRQNVSELVLPKNLVVNYWAKSIETAERVSEIIPMNKRVLKENMMGGIFLDVDLGEPQVEAPNTLDNKPVPIQLDDTTPHSIVEQHCFWDMDGDGYAEPYIVTFERHSHKVLRVVARFDDKSIKTIVDSKGKTKLAKIKPIQYYTKFGFIPNPEGGFYDVGFGLLLGPLNESVNTLINQLIDSGTINNLNGGFLGKGLKLKMGESQWKPGEWKSVTSTAEDLRKQIVPLPSKEPSKVLFELLTSLINGAKELASVAEIMVGKMPGQNTPATTTMATIEQGMKVFTAVYKRVYRSLRSEFKKIFDLNGTYLDSSRYQAVVDVPIDGGDFDNESYDVCPGADPNTATASEKLMKAQGLMELLPTGVLDPVAVVSRVLEAQEQPNFQQLFNQQIQQTGQFQPPPDPKILALQAKQQADEKKAQMDMIQMNQKMEIEKTSAQAELAMKAQEHQVDQNHEMQMGMLKAKSQMAMTDARMASGAAETGQKMQQTEASHQQSMSHQKEKQALQQKAQSQKPKSTTGKSRK